VVRDANDPSMTDNGDAACCRQRGVVGSLLC
jgi:hypothetical protein